jgi:hypothetical protein
LTLTLASSERGEIPLIASLPYSPVELTLAFCNEPITLAFCNES